MAPDGLTTSVVSHVFALISKDSAHSYAVGQQPSIYDRRYIVPKLSY